MSEVACPKCQKRYQVPASAAGKTVKCQACGVKFRLAAPKATKAPPVDPVADSLEKEFDDAFSDGLPDLANDPAFDDLPSEGAQQLRSFKPTRTASSSSGETLFFVSLGVNIVYRLGMLGLVAAPFLYGRTREVDEEAITWSGADTIWFLSFFFIPVWLYLAAVGVKFTRESMQTRAVGFGIMGGGVAGVVIGIGALNLAEDAMRLALIGMMLIAGGVLGAVFGFFQLVSGQDLGSSLPDRHLR